VNCIIKDDDGSLIGDNTDGKGFLRAIQEIQSVAGMRVLVLGAGGAARAIITELALHGAEHITVANRSDKRAQDILDTIGKKVPTSLERIPFDGSLTIGAEYDLVVQATSVGLFDPEGGFDITWEPKRSGTRIAADVVFNPIETQFLKGAESAGATCVDGLGMLVYQGAVGISNWTGRDADCKIMRTALEEAFTL
jgi:shikimate dehydrogenase